MALLAHAGYIMPREYEIYHVGPGDKRNISYNYHMWLNQHGDSTRHSTPTTAPDTECATLPATARTANIGPCIGHYQAGPLQLGPSRYCCLPAKLAAVCAECRCSAHLFSSGVRTHTPTAPGPSLVTRTNPVSVVCSGISLCAWHSTGVFCRQPVADRHQSLSTIAIFALPT